MASNPKNLMRFNDSKKYNVNTRHICSASDLVLYQLPAPGAARPAKGAVPFDAASQFSDSMDGMPSMRADLFYSSTHACAGGALPSSPAVPLSALTAGLPDPLDDKLTLDCYSLQELFASAMVMGLKSEESFGNPTKYTAGKLVGVRSGTRRWDPDKQGAPGFLSGYNLPKRGDATVIGAMRLSEARPKGVLARAIGEQATADRVGLPYDHVGAFCASVLEACPSNARIACPSHPSGDGWGAPVAVTATRREGGRADLGGSSWLACR